MQVSTRHTRLGRTIVLSCAFLVASCTGGENTRPSLYSLKVLSGDNQTGEAGAELPEPIRVMVSTEANGPASSVKVTFTVQAGGGNLSDASVVTDENGQAAVFWTLGSPPVLNRVKAEVTGGSVSVRAWAAPGEQPILELLYQGSAGNGSENLAFWPGRGLFLGRSGGLRNMPAPGDDVRDVPITGEPILSPLGFAFGDQGDLYLCENLPPVSSALKRITPDGVSEVLTTGFNGHPFALPNYVAVHSSGEIFMSSTCDNMIYRISPHDGSTSEFISITAPNGIAFNPDESYLYILTENPLFFCGGPDVPGGLYRTSIGSAMEAGQIEPLVENFAVAGDGLAFDAEGNLYCVFSGVLDGTLEGLLTSGVFVYTPEGRFHEYATVDLPRDIFTNIAFGLPPFDPFSLYAYGFTGRLYRMDVGIRGLPLARKRTTNR